MFARPVDLLLVSELQQQLELFDEKFIVIFEFEAEQRECLDKGTAPHHHLGSALGKEV
jgi:hypothetical protein